MSQVQWAVFGECGGSYAAVGTSNLHRSGSPSHRDHISNAVRYSIKNQPQFYAAGSAVVYRNAESRFGLYAGITWDRLHPHFRLINIPDSFYSHDNVTVHVKQHSFRFRLGIERKCFKSKKGIIGLGALLDYNTYPQFSAEQPMLVNTYVMRQFLVGINFNLGVIVPATNNKLMLRYFLDIPFEYQFINTIQHQLDRYLESSVVLKYNYHQIGLSYQLF